MAYESKHLSRFKARYDNDNDDNDLIFQLVRSGAKITPTSATIAIYKPGTATAVLAATAMTASGSLLTYAIDTTTTGDYPVGTGYRAHIVTTVGSTTYEDNVYFDVVKNVPSGRIGRDQLVALDDRVRNMDHAGDSDFSELISAVWDEVQLDLETRTIDGEQLLDDMVVDRSRLSVVARFLVLSRLLRPKGHATDAEYYEKTYKTKLKQLLSAGPFDVNQDQVEDADQNTALTIRVAN